MIAVLRVFLIMVEVVSALLLIGAILIQRTRSQGIGMAFGSGMGESLFGAHVGNVLTKITVILAIVFLLNTTLMALLQSGGAEASSVTDGIEQMPAPIAAPIQPLANMPSELPTDLETAIPETPVTDAVLPAVDTTVTTDTPAVDVVPTADTLPTEAASQDAPAVTP